MSSIRKNLKRVEEVFMTTAIQIHSLKNAEDIQAYLESVDSIFRSVAYECASYLKAYQSLITHGDLREWNEFDQLHNDDHIFHIWVGLGWGISKAEKLAVQSSMSNDKKRSLVIDGIGYYHALYKGRQTLKAHTYPEDIEEKDKTYFDVGVGRRLWYHCFGQIEGLKTILQGFQKNRLPSLWRGIGVASAYVGGDEVKTFKQLEIVSGQNVTNFREGQHSALFARIKANSRHEQIEWLEKSLGLSGVNFGIWHNLA